MSFVDEPSSTSGVLPHPAPCPAVFLPSHPSDEALAFNWTLSERDIEFILTNHRGPEQVHGTTARAPRSPPGWRQPGSQDLPLLIPDICGIVSRGAHGQGS